MTAARRWSDQLDEWAIPEHLLAAVDESPYGWSQTLWKRRSERSRVEDDETVTTTIARRLLTSGDGLIDVGAGRGRASLPLAAEGHPLVAVEKNPDMVAGLREDAARLGANVSIVEGAWPEAAAELDSAPVVMSAHVVYDVPDIGPFLTAMHRLATSGVVLEVTPSHPWSGMAPYYRALHHIDRPSGPTADDLVAVIEEVVGVVPEVEWWARSGQMWFSDWDEITEFYGRRLVLPPGRRHEVRPLVEPDVTEVDGRLFVGDPVRRLATIWWLTA